MSTILGHILTNSFGTKTTVNHAAITTRTANFWGLQINNKKKMKSPYALRIGKIAVKAPITSYFAEDIEIESIKLKDLTLNIEAVPGSSKTNWDPILKHINESSKGNKKSNRDSTVKLLTIDNITINVTDSEGKVTTNKIKNLTFKNLSTKNGDITAQIARAVLLKMIFNVQNMIKIPLQVTQDQLNNVFKFGNQNTKFRFGPPKANK